MSINLYAYEVFTDSEEDFSGFVGAEVEGGKVASITKHTSPLGTPTTWTKPEDISSVDVLIVGGGGRGVFQTCYSPTCAIAGGGGGEVKVQSNVSVTGNVSVTVGNVGTGIDPEASSQSSFGILVARGGGGCSSGKANGSGRPGGFLSGDAPDNLEEPACDSGFDFVGGSNYQHRTFGPSTYISVAGGGAGNGDPILGLSGTGGDATKDLSGVGGYGRYVDSFSFLGDDGWFGAGGRGSSGANIDYPPAALPDIRKGTGKKGTGGGANAISGSNNTSTSGWSGVVVVRYVIGTESAPCVDMNPAHIIRECLTDKEWGMGYNAADIDDVSFTAAADTLYDEQMGISILWQRENTIEAFVQDIVRHIDAALYVDRRTGKFVLKLIRDDYSESDLITLGPDQIERVENYKRPAFGDLVNSVTVIYDECDDGKLTGPAA